MIIDSKLLLLCGVFLIPAIISSIATYFMQRAEIKQLKVVILHLLTIERERVNIDKAQAELTRQFHKSIRSALFEKS